MRGLVFWTLLPFVLPQALNVRRTAPRFAAPACATFGQVAGDRSVRLLGIGDSLIAGVGAATLDRALVAQTARALGDALSVGVDWHCTGSIGATSQKVLQTLLPALPSDAADFILLSAGVNDITSLASLRQWRRALDALLAGLHRHSPQAVIVVAGIPPLQQFPILPRPLRNVLGLRGRAFDAAAHAVVARHPSAAYATLETAVRPLSFAADGFHPSETSYADLARIVAATMVDRAARAGDRHASPRAA